MKARTILLSLGAAVLVAAGTWYVFRPRRSRSTSRRSRAVRCG